MASDPRCECGRSMDYGPEASMCRRCALDYVSGLPDLEVVGHHAVQLILSRGRLVGVALVVVERGESAQKSRADVKKLRGVDVVV